MSDDKRLNEVIRVQKRPNSFVLIDKGFLENTNMSWKAKGILAYLLSKPDSWKVIVKDLINHATDGKAAVYTGLNELKECGYYEKRPIRNEKGHFIRWESTVYESPDLPLAKNREVDATLVKSASQPLPDYPDMDYPNMDYPDMENRERSNNYISNNDCINNHVSQVSLNNMEDEQDEDGTDDLIHKIG